MSKLSSPAPIAQHDAAILQLGHALAAIRPGAAQASLNTAPLRQAALLITELEAEISSRFAGVMDHYDGAIQTLDRVRGILLCAGQAQEVGTHPASIEAAVAAAYALLESASGPIQHVVNAARAL